MSSAPTPFRAAPAPTPPAATLTLAESRAAFLTAVRRDTPGTDLARYTAVLDALLAWSAARPGRVVFRAGAGVRFDRVGHKGALWVARTTSGGAPTLEIAPSPGAALTAEGRARATATLNAHSRAVLAPDDRLRIGFGALKNAAACAAVLALLDDLLDRGFEAPPATAGA